MKNKLIINFLFLTMCLYSQGIEVKTSLIYKKEKNFLLQKEYGKRIKVPYLKIVYYNNSTNNYYFLPNLSDFEVFSRETKESTKIKPINDTTIEISHILRLSPYNEDFFYNLYDKNEIWNNVSFKLGENNILTVDSISQKVSYMNLRRLLNQQEILNNKFHNYQLKFFNYPNKEKMGIKEANKITRKELDDNLSRGYFDSEINNEQMKRNPNFVFLKPKRKYISYISLKALSYLTNRISFTIDSFKFPEILTIISCPEDNEFECTTLDKMINMKYQKLPLNIGEYKLYRDSVIIRKERMEVIL